MITITPKKNIDILSNMPLQTFLDWANGVGWLHVGQHYWEDENQTELIFISPNCITVNILVRDLKVVTIYWSNNPVVAFRGNLLGK